MTETVIFYGTSLTALLGWTDLIQQGATQAQVALNVINTAAAGQDSVWGDANVQANVVAYHPNVVVMEFAINDAFLPYNISLQQEATLTLDMISQIKASDPGVQIFLATTNEPVPGSPDALARPDVDAYYANYRAIAAQTGVGLIDNNLVWKQILSENPAGYAAMVSDTLHPSEAADVAVTIPDTMVALNLSFPVIDPGVAAAMPIADQPMALLYPAAFGRLPDLAGLDAWLATGLPATTVASFLVQSAEWQADHAGQSAAALTTSLYENALGRAPGAAEIAAWENLPAATQLVGIGASAEAIAHNASWLTVF